MFYCCRSNVCVHRKCNTIQMIAFFIYGCGGSNPNPNAKKSPIAYAIGDFLAEDEGFEPPQTESESGVLPLHKSSWWRLRDSNL